MRSGLQPLFCILMLTLSGCSSTGKVDGSENHCGDGMCDLLTETCAECPGDCGVCQSEMECGDGVAVPGEECDAGDNNGVLCSPPYGSSCGYCSISCEYLRLQGASCGDSSCDAPDEDCDSCAADCGACGPDCGNGILETNEDCDQGSSNGDMCTAAYDSSCDYCSASCATVTVDGPSCGDGTCQDQNEDCASCPGDCDACPESCGNGSTDQGEECDNASANGVVCTPDYDSSCSYCSLACRNVTITGGSCGDGTCDAGDEDCGSCEADCFSCALEKLVIYSATDNGAKHEEENPIESAYDEDLETRWSARPVPIDISFDLGAVQEVHQTRLSFYRWDQARVYQYATSVSTDGVSYTEVVATKGSQTTQWTIDGITPVNARFVRVHIASQNESDWAGLWEAEIYGVHLGDPANAAPLVNAGSDTTAYLGLPLSLLATVSDDGLPDPPAAVAIAWSKESGPGNVVFSDASSATPTATFDALGSYVLKLFASDSELSSNDTVAVEVVEVQSGTGFLPPDRSIEWHSGVPGGIPSSAWQVYTTLPSQTSDSAIQDALNSAPSNTVVQLAAGTYQVGSRITVPAHKALRGAGEEATVLECSTGTCVRLGSGGPGSYVSVTGGFQLGSTEIQVADGSGFTVGRYADIRQDWDDSYFQCGYDNGGVCPSWGYAAVGQALKIVAKDGNTLTLEEPLFFGYTADFNPRAAPDSKVEHAGLEDLRIEKTSDADGDNVAIANCAYCWVRNVWSEKATGFHVDVSYAYKAEIRDSIFNEMTAGPWGSVTYGVRLQSRSSNVLIENCVFNKVRHAMAMEIGPSGNVWGYNYSHDPYSSTAPGWLFSDLALHGHYPTMNLYEGNVGQNADVDNVWGTNGPTTFFRNRIIREVTTVDDPCTHSHVEIAKENAPQNVIGNELGVAGQCADDGVINIDPTMEATVLDHGNYDYLNGEFTHWDASLSQDLPASLYLQGKPAFFGSTPWPPYGPEQVGSGNKIPAQIRFENLRAAGKL